MKSTVYIQRDEYRSLKKSITSTIYNITQPLKLKFTIILLGSQCNGCKS